MVSEFELYYASLSEIEKYLRSRYRLGQSNATFSQNFSGNLPFESRSDFGIIFRHLNINISLYEKGKFKVVSYSVNMIPFNVSCCLALLLLAAISFLIMDTSKYFGGGLPVLLIFVVQFRWTIRQGLEELAKRDKESIINQRDRKVAPD